MTNLEYSDVYRFLASLGVVLIALSLLAPWLFLRDDFAALHTQSEVSELPQEAQELVTLRQNRTLWLVKNIWWISSLLAGTGLMILVSGATQWVKKQRTIDRREALDAEKAELEVEKARRELEPMTQEEIAAEGISEVVEGMYSAESAEAPVLDSARSSVRQHFRIEELVLSKLTACFGEKSLATHQRLRQAGYSIVFDAVLLSDSETLPDVIIDVKVSSPGLRKHIQTTSMNLAAQLRIYQHSTGRKASAVILLVTAAGAAGSPEPERDVLRIRELARIQEVDIRAVFLSEEELAALSCAELREKIEPSAVRN